MNAGLGVLLTDSAGAHDADGGSSFWSDVQNSTNVDCKGKGALALWRY